MKTETIEIAGFKAALMAMRLPHKSKGDSEGEMFLDSQGWNKTRTNYALDYGTDDYLVIGPKDLSLAQKLIIAGDEHAKCMRGINVWVEITAPWYWWNEWTTYVIGNIPLDDATPLSSTSSMHIDCKGLKGEELQKAIW